MRAEYDRLTAIDGVSTTEPIGGEGPVPRMFSIVDPDGNHSWVRQAGDEPRTRLDLAVLAAARPRDDGGWR